MPVTEIEYDTETGLPVLPEGYFWRIGEVDTNPRWYGDKTPYMEPAVLIMKEAGMVTKTRKVPVYGKQWWNKHQVVDELTETYEEMDGPTQKFSMTFSGLETRDKSTIPDFAKDRGASNTNGVEHTWHFDVPVGKEGAAYLAGRLYRTFLEWEEHKRRKEAFQKALAATKEEIYGDYPPKSLLNT
ncbi:hypothetical protein SEA_ATUIN_257 [Arthrobacter phage Atuin]|nr:hypothetical protein SEA_ATUIN_56 [Arthrobacter phage Atuin]